MFKKVKLLSFLAIICSTLVFTQILAYANYFNGGVFYGTTLDKIDGVSASISYNSKPAVYNDSMTSAWSAIGNTSYGNIAQVGWAIDPPDKPNVYYFFGYINTNGVYYEKRTGYAPAMGSTLSYKVIYTTVNGIKRAYGYIDNVQYFDVVIDWLPNAAQYLTEIRDTSAQFAGKSTLHERFSNISIRQSGVWKTPTLTWCKDGTAAGQSNSSYASSKYFEVWDTRY